MTRLATLAGAALMVIGTILALPGYAIVSLGGALLCFGDRRAAPLRLDAPSHGRSNAR